MIDFVLSKKQQELKEGIHNVGKFVIRPMSLEMDRNHEVPEPFLRNFMKLAGGRGGQDIENFGEDGSGEEGKKERDPSKISEANRTSAVGAEELAWADAAMVLCMPGAGLGGPPVKSTGTPEQRKRFLGMFKGMDTGPLKWGAYGLTEPGAGSDVSGIRSSCRKDGKHWVLNGRKCYITNGGRAIWTVIFATIDPALGRAGHRAFVVEKGTPGFEVGKIEEKMGLRANETAELVLEDCRVPEENLLGGEAAYTTKEGGFMTAMKTFDNTRPLVGAMAVGIGRAAYEYARDFVKENYLIGRPIPRYAAIAAKLSQVSRKLDAARMLVWRATYMADMGIPNAKEASMSKAAAGQAATQACIDAIEICGAHGSIATEHALLEKWFRDVKVYDIFEGTGNIQRIVIAKRIMPGLKAF